MYLLICQTLEIRLVHYPFINQGTHSFSGRGIKFLLKTTSHCSEGEPPRGLLPLPLNVRIQIFQNDCQGFLTLVLPCVGIGIPIYPSDFKEDHFLITFYLPRWDSNLASFTSSNCVTFFLLILYLNASKWFGSITSSAFFPGLRWLFLHCWNLLLLLG